MHKGSDDAPDPNIYYRTIFCSLIFLTEPIDFVTARPRSDRGNLNGFGTESHYFAAAGYYHCPALSVRIFLCA